MFYDLLIFIFMSYIKPQPASSKHRIHPDCISYYSYIKPQRRGLVSVRRQGCISYYSYIKPQQEKLCSWAVSVVYRTIPTSNHNLQVVLLQLAMLYIVLFLHQTTTLFYSPFTFFSCISYYSYIKPQRYPAKVVLFRVVYRTIPTSNHNSR